MAYRIFYTSDALEELESILEFIRADNPSAAERFGTGLLNHVDLLASFPRLGAPVPESEVDPILDVRTHAFVGAVVSDPIEWAESFAAPFGLTEAFRNPDAPLQDPVVGLGAPDCVIALYRLPGATGTALWGAEHHRPRFHLLGLGVSDLGEAEQVLRQTGISVLRQDEGSITLDPRQTGEVPLMLIEGLLPGDPRL